MDHFDATASAHAKRKEALANIRNARHLRNTHAKQTQLNTTLLPARNTLLRALRRHAHQRRARRDARREYDAHFANADTDAAASPPHAAALLARLRWLLTFYEPERDGTQLAAACALVSASLTNADARVSFAANGLNRALARSWLGVLRTLLGACAAHIRGGGGTGRGLESSSDGSSDGSLANSLGPPLRLLLMLAEPSKWDITQACERSGATAAAEALRLMTTSMYAAEAETLVEALGARLEASTLKGPLLGAAVSVALLALQLGGEGKEHALLGCLVVGVLSLPALMAGCGGSPLSAAIQSRLRADHSALWRACSRHAVALTGSIQLRLSARSHPADAAIAIAANLSSLALPSATRDEVDGSARLLRALFDVAAAAAPAPRSGQTVYHPLLGWSGSAPQPSLLGRADAVRRQLEHLWSAEMLRSHFGELMVPLDGARRAHAVVAELGKPQADSLSTSVGLSSSMYISCLRALQPLRAQALSQLAYSSQLASAAWALASSCSSRGGRSVEQEVLDRGGGSLGSLVALSMELAAHLLPVLSDHEIFEEPAHFSASDLDSLSRSANNLAYELTWLAAPEAAAACACHEPAMRLVALLNERDSRGRPFRPPKAWLVPRLPLAEVEREFGAWLRNAQPLPHHGRIKRLLGATPWAVPFETRVRLFRELVDAERARLPGESLPEHLVGHRIKVRRARLLEDGYAQLCDLPAERIRGTIRVEFVSELGLAEAGIDRHGVFKEFLEETFKHAFDTDRALFARCDSDGKLYPSVASTLAEADDERLFHFVGKMLGKAVFEGIVIGSALADFFVTKLLGKRPGLDELGSLDPQLAKQLDFVKRYEGDVEGDLCLSFTIDEEEFGARRTVDLRDGGAAIAVSAANRIEYCHLLADYRLNKQTERQCRAFCGGFHSVVPPAWLRLFNTPELQRLISGDTDTPIDVADLRRHAKYAGGYHAASPAVRDLWSVLGKLSDEDRAKFLKFVTSCSRPPLLGFAHLNPPLTVQCVSGDDGEGVGGGSVLAFLGLGRKETRRLPTASTCFNLLKLPNYRSRSVLRERLLYAIRSAEGFELS